MGRRGEYDFSKTPNIDTVLREIHCTYGENIRRYIAQKRGADAVDDIYQKVLIRVAQHHHTYDPTKSSMNSWLHTIAKNLIRNDIRDEQKRLVVSMNTVTNPADERNLEYRLAFEHPAQTEKEILEYFQKRLANLPNEQREVIYLQLIEGLPYAEIARRQGVKIGTARSRRNRGMQEAFPEMLKRKRPAQ
jgi:RNA polymerase sigma-70 factor (ECF subfamily)